MITIRINNVLIFKCFYFEVENSYNIINLYSIVRDIHIVDS